MSIYAKVIADSLSPDGDRLTTIEVRLHRFVLAELNTHRAFSRNSASSRAIPFEKQLARLDELGIAYPVEWPYEQRGMQGSSKKLSPPKQREARKAWDQAAMAAAHVARALHQANIHKSVINRLLEPFMWHTVVITSTVWENFFSQRCSPLAQPELREAAEAIELERNLSEPKQLKDTDWHLPYFHDEDYDIISDMEGVQYEWPQMISAARCARVSYLTQDGKRDIEADLKLYERLVTADPPHWSPLEHVATPWSENAVMPQLSFEWNGEELLTKGAVPLVGNLLGWRSLRTTIEAEKGISTYV